MFERIARAFLPNLEKNFGPHGHRVRRLDFDNTQRNFTLAAHVGARRSPPSPAYGYPAVPAPAESLRARAHTVSRPRRLHPVERVDDLGLLMDAPGDKRAWRRVTTAYLRTTLRQLSAAAERGVTSRAGLTILGEARGVLQVQSSSALAVARHDSWRASDAVRAAGAHVRGERFASVYVHDNLKCRQCSCVLHGYPGYRYHAARIEMFVREPHQESYRRIRKFAAVFHVHGT